MTQAMHPELGESGWLISAVVIAIWGAARIDRVALRSLHQLATNVVPLYVECLGE